MFGFRKRELTNNTSEQQEEDGIINIVSVCGDVDSHAYSLYYKTDVYEKITPQDLLVRVKVDGEKVNSSITTEMVRSCNSWQELEEKTVVSTLNKVYRGKYGDISEVGAKDIIKIIGKLNYDKWVTERIHSDRLKEDELLKVFYKLPKSTRDSDNIVQILEAMIAISRE